MKHYHLLAGQHGCLPDFNETFETENEAKQAMLDEYKYTLIMDENFKPGMVKGSYNVGYYEINPILGWEYMEINECDYQDCLEVKP